MRPIFARVVGLAIFLSCGTTAPSILLAASLIPGDLIVIDPYNLSLPGKGVIVKIDSATGAQTLIAKTTSLEQPQGGCLDSTGNLIVADYGYIGAGGIYRIDPATGEQTLISSGGALSHPTSVAIDGSGNLIVTQQGPSQADGAVLKIDPVTGEQTVVASGVPLAVLQAIVIEPSGNYLLSNFSSPTIGPSIVRADASSGEVTPISFGGQLPIGPFGIALNHLQGESLLVAQHQAGVGGALLDVDLQTGESTVVSSGGVLASPIDVTQDAVGNTFVLDFRSQSVVRVNTASGEQTLISSGGYLATPTRIFAVVPEPGTLGHFMSGALVLLACARRRSSNSLARQPDRMA